MNKHRFPLLVFVVLVMATLALGWGSAQARPPAGWSPGSSGGSNPSPRPIAVITSGDPDVGQTIVVRHRVGRVPEGEGHRSWYQRVRSVWAAWYLRAAL